MLCQQARELAVLTLGRELLERLGVSVAVAEPGAARRRTSRSSDRSSGQLSRTNSRRSACRETDPGGWSSPPAAAGQKLRTVRRL